MIPTTRIAFPEIHLPTRQAHHLRGYFGNLFRDHSPLLHNHLEGGKLRFAYPLVQYRVVDGVPELIGFREGATLLRDLFLQIRELDIAGRIYPLHEKQLVSREAPLDVVDDLFRYRFATHYLPLKTPAYHRYQQTPLEERPAFLNRLLRNHLLAVFKGLNVWLEPHQRILVNAKLEERRTNFKNQQMISFLGTFTTNARLPEGVGVGSSVARGYGVVIADC